MPIAAKGVKTKAGRSPAPTKPVAKTVAKTAAKPKDVAATSGSAPKKPVPKAAPKAVQRKPTAAKAPGAPVSAARKRRLAKVDADQRQHYVAVAAYYIAERRGFLGGCEADDWTQAEREIDRLLAEGKLSV